MELRKTTTVAESEQGIIVTLGFSPTTNSFDESAVGVKSLLALMVERSKRLGSLPNCTWIVGTRSPFNPASPRAALAAAPQDGGVF